MNGVMNTVSSEIPDSFASRISKQIDTVKNNL